MEQLLLLGSLLGRLETGISPGSKLVLKLLDPPGSVNKLKFTGVKGVTDVANVNLEFFACTAGVETIPATAGHFGFEVLRVDAIFHDSDLGMYGGVLKETRGVATVFDLPNHF
jgi:hypothetical protein